MADASSLMSGLGQSTDVYTTVANYLGVSVETVIYVILIVLVWKLIWYGLAIYKSIEKKQKIWFVVLFLGTFIFNDLGILAIIYLIIYRDKKPKRKR